MWSFGTKREDTAQVAPDKVPSTSNNHIQQQQQQQQPLPTRQNSSLRADTQQPDPPSPKGGGAIAAKSRMFYKNKKQAATNSKNNATSPSRRSQEAKTDRSAVSQSKNFMAKRFGRGSKNNINGDDYLQDISVNETSNGIEVSFPGSEATMKAKPVISLKEQIRERQRVYKSQFSTVAPASSDLSSSAVDKNSWSPNGHRIPLLGITAAETSYADAVQLLKDVPVVDEQAAVQQELTLLETEISSLERDRIWLEQNMNGESHGESDSYATNKENVRGSWDAHKLLKDDAIKKQPLSASERNLLQKHRGNSLTFCLYNPRTQDLFVNSICGKQQSVRIASLCKDDSSITTTMPCNNRSADSAATNLQHVSLLSSMSTMTNDPGLYLCRDVGQPKFFGNVPRRLSQRLQDRRGKRAGEIVYLSTGSRGCYFAQFQSGECWWGSAAEDADFQFIMESWDVYRVAFGPIGSIEVYSRKDNIYKNLPTSSWIILSHDGNAAWKNLPSRLSTLLEQRLANAAAPVEVSLGPGDSYFVRFLDGSIDYSLPSKVARACEQIEERGGKITNVSLHPEVSQNFVIRHTELTR